MNSNSLFARVYKLWSDTQKWHIPVWIVLHVAVVVLFLLHPQFIVKTDLYTVLPESNPNQMVSKAEQRISAQASATFTVLVGNKDFETARSAAQRFYQNTQGHSGIEDLVLNIDPNLFDTFQQYLHDYRYRILPDETLALLEKGEMKVLANNALQVVGNPLAVGALSNIDTDPFLLADRSLRAFLSSGILSNMSVSVRQGVLASQHEGVWYVLLTGTLKGKGATETDGNPVPALRAVAGEIRTQFLGTEFVFSGIPFHTYDSSTQAQSEIQLISTISMVAVILILVLVFFSVVPLGATLLSMFAGIGIGTLATFVCFREVHLFTIVFGTSLIGISIDYSLHYFSEWMNPKDPHDGPSVIKRILPGITMGLITTLVSYAAFSLAPFPLLRQMALFSSVGLASTWLSVVLLYPKFKPPRRVRPQIPLVFSSTMLGFYERFARVPAAVRLSLLVVVVVIGGVGLSKVHFNNDLKAMYRMGPEMAEQEKKSAAVLQHGSSGAYFIVRGRTAEETLIREEALTSRLGDLQATGGLGAWTATSTLLPSHLRQEKVYRLANSLSGALPAHMESLGFGTAEVAAVRTDYEAKIDVFIDPQYYFTLPLAKFSKGLWIGEIDGEYFSTVFLFNVKDKSALRQLASQHENIYFINKAEDTAEVLQDLSRLAVILLISAYVFIFFGLWYLYGLRDSLKISAVPVAASLLTCAALGFSGLPFNLFAIVGLILVPGIGIDYAIFYKEGAAHRAVTMLAVTLSMISTILSFGSLAFSTLAGVFGFTVAIGVTISFILAPLTLPRGPNRIAKPVAQPRR